MAGLEPKQITITDVTRYYDEYRYSYPYEQLNNKKHKQINEKKPKAQKKGRKLDHFVKNLYYY
jgi:hypothetical protein